MVSAGHWGGFPSSAVTGRCSPLAGGLSLFGCWCGGERSGAEGRGRVCHSRAWTQGPEQCLDPVSGLLPTAACHRLGRGFSSDSALDGVSLASGWIRLWPCQWPWRRGRDPMEGGAEQVSFLISGCFCPASHVCSPSWDPEAALEPPEDGTGPFKVPLGRLVGCPTSPEWALHLPCHDKQVAWEGGGRLSPCHSEAPSRMLPALSVCDGRTNRDTRMAGALWCPISTGCVSPVCECPVFQQYDHAFCGGGSQRHPRCPGRRGRGVPGTATRATGRETGWGCRSRSRPGGRSHVPAPRGPMLGPSLL